MGQSWTTWESALRDAFQPDRTNARLQATNRKWEWASETAAAYFYSKLSLLRAAYPSHDDSDHIQEIQLVTPPSFQMHIRSHMAIRGSLNNTLVEIKTMEGAWRLATGSILSVPTPNLATSASADTTKAQLPPSPPQKTYIRSPSAIPNNMKCSFRSLAEDYEPANISYTLKDGRNTRTYKMPYSGKVINLNRPCRTCDGDHFEFEHDHLNKNLKSENHHHLASVELQWAKAYGYTITDPDIIDVDNYSPDSSFTSESSSSTHPSGEGRTVTSEK